MPDRVKEAVFGILGSIFNTPGELPDFGVADVFAGSGSLGLEAVSRGAGGCVFYERDRTALHVLHSNIDSFDQSGALKVEAADAWRLRNAKLASVAGPFGVVFLDPPYRDARDTGPGSRLFRLIELFFTSGCLRPDAVVVVHHERRITLECPAAGTWQVFDRREYGSTAITFIRAAALESDAPGADEPGGDSPQPQQADLAPPTGETAP